MFTRVGAPWYTLFGAALGAAAGFAMRGSQGTIPFTLLALLLLAVWALLRGAWSAGPVAGVVLLLLVRWQALSFLATDPVASLAAAVGLGHAAAVALAWSARPNASGVAMFAGTLSTPVALAAIAQGVLFAFFPGTRLASFLLGGSVAVALLCRAYFLRRHGGIDDGSVALTGELVETFCLVVYTCRPCTE